MNALHVNRHHFDALSAKHALRAHVDQLPPEKQYEFILTALHLMAVRPSPAPVESSALYQPGLQNRKYIATH